MTQPGKSIKVARSVVTGIRIDPAGGVLYIEGVDQDADGNTLRSHQLTFPPVDQSGDVTSAVATIQAYSAHEIHKA